jgi:hypothetical protein
MLDKTKKHEETYLNELKEQALFGDCVIWWDKASLDKRIDWDWRNILRPHLYLKK